MNAGMAAARLVHALDEQAKAFYLGRGFIESPIEPIDDLNAESGADSGMITAGWKRKRKL